MKISQHLHASFDGTFIKSANDNVYPLKNVRCGTGMLRGLSQYSPQLNSMACYVLVVKGFSRLRFVIIEFHKKRTKYVIYGLLFVVITAEENVQRPMTIKLAAGLT
jgi:hypothetical protein